MNQIITLLSKIKNLWPYLFLILLYLFFINAEANRDNDNYKGKKINVIDKSYVIKSTNQNNETINSASQRISIPVIPFIPNKK